MCLRRVVIAARLSAPSRVEHEDARHGGTYLEARYRDERAARRREREGHGLLATVLCECSNDSGGYRRSVPRGREHSRSRVRKRHARGLAAHSVGILTRQGKGEGRAVTALPSGGHVAAVP